VPERYTAVRTEITTQMKWQVGRRVVAAATTQGGDTRWLFLFSFPFFYVSIGPTQWRCQPNSTQCEHTLLDCRRVVPIAVSYRRPTNGFRRFRRSRDTDVAVAYFGGRSVVGSYGERGKTQSNRVRYFIQTIEYILCNRITN